MTPTDIARMARKARLPACHASHPVALARFASLVAASERNAVWEMLFEYAGRDDLSDSDQSLLKHLADLLRTKGES